MDRHTVPAQRVNAFLMVKELLWGYFIQPTFGPPDSESIWCISWVILLCSRGRLSAEGRRIVGEEAYG